MSQRSSARYGLAVLLTAVALVATACSSSGHTTTHSGSAATSPAAQSGTPIVIGSSGPIQSSLLSQPERLGAEQAAIKAINASGGVHGHPLKLDFCDTKYTASGEITCMRQLVQDKVSAIVAPGNIADQSGAGYKVAAAANVPVVGGQGLLPAEFNTKDVFPLSSGIPGWAYGQVVALLDAGAKKIALYGTTEAGSVFILSLAAAALKDANVKPVRTVSVDINADPTFASGAAKAIAGGVDGIVIDLDPSEAPKAVTALRQAGYQGKIAGITGTFTPPIVKALGADADGLLLSSQVAFPSDTSDPAVAAYLAAMKKYSPSAQIDETSEFAWAAVQLYAKVMANATTFTSAATSAAFGKLSTPIDLRLAGRYQVVGHTAYVAQFPNMYNPTIQVGIAKDGVITPDGRGFINPFTALKKFRTRS